MEPSPSTFHQATQICNQIAAVFSNPTGTHPPPLDTLVSTVVAAAARNGKVFIYGVGREGLMLKALCMRLSHLGLSTHFVFDMTTPPISTGDLLVTSAGPGGFSTVEALCSVAREAGGEVLLLTAQPEKGSCVRYASKVCYVPAMTMADDGDDGVSGGGGRRLLLPMGSVYEGALFEMAVIS